MWPSPRLHQLVAGGTATGWPASKVAVSRGLRFGRAPIQGLRARHTAAGQVHGTTASASLWAHDDDEDEEHEEDGEGKGEGEEEDEDGDDDRPDHDGAGHRQQATG